MSKLKCKDCESFEECFAGEGDSPEDYECDFFAPKETVEPKTDETNSEEDPFKEEVEQPAKKTTKKKAKTKPKKTKAKKAKEQGPKETPKKEKDPVIPKEKDTKEDTKDEEITKESVSIDDEIINMIEKRMPNIAAKVKFLMELVELRPELKSQITASPGILDRLADLITTEEAVKITALLL